MDNSSDREPVLPRGKLLNDFRRIVRQNTSVWIAWVVEQFYGLLLWKPLRSLQAHLNGSPSSLRELDSLERSLFSQPPQTVLSVSGVAGVGTALALQSYRRSLLTSNNYILLLQRDTDFGGLLARIACLIQAAREMNTCVSAGRFESLQYFGTDLETRQYQNLFATYRSPESSNFDSLRRVENSTWVAVICGGKWFKLALELDDKPLSLGQIYASLHHITQTVSDFEAPLVGALTGLPRKEWRHWRTRLLANDGTRLAVEVIEQALFVVCLDLHINFEDSQSAWRHLRDGNPGCRWWDKSIQLIATGGDFIGIHFEHAAIDGHVAVEFIRDMNTRAAELRSDMRRVVAHRADFAPLDERLFFDLDEELSTQAQAAIHVLETQRRAFFHGMCKVEQLGRDACRTIGISADAVLQIALQSAFYLCMGRHAQGVHEVAHTRKLAGGRYTFVPIQTKEVQKCVAQIAAGELNREDLQQAVESIRSEVKRVREGTDLITYLFALSCFLGSGSASRKALLARLSNHWIRLVSPLHRLVYPEMMTSSFSGVADVVHGSTVSQRNHGALCVAYVLTNDDWTVDLWWHNATKEKIENFCQGLQDAVSVLTSCLNGEVKL